MYILVDCNNFFASCEKLFRPDWKHDPVIVLSNNDGCVIARSPEAKTLGISMCDPYFKLRPLIARENVRVCSGNFPLYSDISSRVMRVLEEFDPDLHVYSIDEAFLQASLEPDALLALARDIKETVFKWVGIQVSIGVAPTRTLAKLANECAKKNPSQGGIMCLCDAPSWEQLMDAIPVGDVWGIGRRLELSLRAMGIRTASDLAHAQTTILRKKFGVSVERVIRELQGMSCVDPETLEAPRKQIVCSRTFGNKVADKALLRESLCRFMENAARELRSIDMLAGAVSVFVQTTDDGYGRKHSHSALTMLDAATDDTRKLIRAASDALDKLWNDRLPYRKAGVMLAELRPPDGAQTSFIKLEDDTRNRALMDTLDQLHRQGKNIRFAGQGIATRPWHLRKDWLSPSYTTRWDQLPTAH